MTNARLGGKGMRVARYEELTGAEGRKIYYRPERHAARALYGQIAPSVLIDHTEHELCDLSMTGLAVRTLGRGRDWSTDFDANVPVRLCLGDDILFEGEARIARIEPEPAHTKIALHLTRGFIDIARTLERHREVVAKQALDAAKTADKLVPADYRRHAADVLHFLRRYREVVEKLESHRNGQTGSLHDDFFGHCEERMLEEWRPLWHAGNALVRPILKDPDVLKATKHFTELVLTPEFVEGPIWRQSYEKPRAYPGDFEVMNYVYSWRREGKTTFGRLLHRLGLEVAQIIAVRMVMIQRAIAVNVASIRGEDPVRIANVGCGPAQEIVNYLQQETLPHRVEFTLLDQDRDAVACAHGRVYPELARHGGRAAAHCLHTTFLQLARAGSLFRKIPPQDLIYSVGLADYLTQRRARLFIVDLFEQLAPGGLLMVGNMQATPAGILWPIEFITDWSLTFRTPAEMLDLAAGLDNALIEIKSDPSEQVLFLCARRQ
jgi:hypothetical protein